jgi:lipopolysaccharide transport protein LptA
MRNFLAVCTMLCLAALAGMARGQSSAPSTLSSRPPQSGPEISPSATPKNVKVSPDKSATDKPTPGGSPTAATEQIVTEIYADKAMFDSTKSIGVFNGHIVVIDPRFQIQGDKLTIYISKKQSEGLEKAVVEGNVGVVRERPDPGGGPPSRMVGRSDKAVYTAKNGNFELTGNPRVQQGLNTHVATSPETVMVLNEKGELQTTGPSRTEIRQPPKSESTPTPTPSSASTPKPTP